jgi:peptidoglycan/xylan/chitin deacetylase (PgdA/CDA1 family)
MRSRIKIKAKLAKMLTVTGVATLLSKRNASLLPIFTFHRLKAEPGETTDFDSSVFSLDAAQFREHLRALLGCANPIDESQLIEFIVNDKPLPKNPFMVTFDDGYVDNYNVALPILNELGVPATFFIPTQAIEQRRVGWWDLVYWCLNHTKKNTITVRGKDYAILQPIGTIAEVFIEMFKSMSHQSTAQLIQELAIACEVDLPSLARQSSELMTWDMIKQASQQGITIGSHTHSHRVLSTINPTEQDLELILSKKILEERLSQKINSIAYPVGGYEHINTETYLAAAKAGYKIGYTFLTGVNHLQNLSGKRFDIRRVDHMLDAISYSALFALPKLYANRKCQRTSAAPYLGHEGIKDYV